MLMIKLDEIHEESSNFEKEFLFLLSSLAKHDSEFTLHPTYKAKVGVVYDLGGFDVPAEKLKASKLEAFLSVAAGTSFSSCPKCGSQLLTIQCRCPSCHEQYLVKTDLMVHYECGQVAPVGEFSTRDSNIFTCPKCKKTLRRIGIDYGRPGFGFKCLNCGEISQFPLLFIICDSGHIFKIDELELQKYSTYKVNKETRALFETIDLLSFIEARLKENGVSCEMLARIKGKSGSVHLIPLFVYSDPMTIVDIMIDEPNPELQAFRTLIKCVDIEANGVLLVKEQLEPKLQGIINPAKCKLVTYNEKTTPQTLANEVLEVIGRKN